MVGNHATINRRDPADRVKQERQANGERPARVKKADTAKPGVLPPRSQARAPSVRRLRVSFIPERPPSGANRPAVLVDAKIPCIGPRQWGAELFLLKRRPTVTRGLLSTGQCTGWFQRLPPYLSPEALKLRLGRKPASSRLATGILSECGRTKSLGPSLAACPYASACQERPILPWKISARPAKPGCPATPCAGVRTAQQP